MQNTYTITHTELMQIGSILEQARNVLTVACGQRGDVPEAAIEVRGMLERPMDILRSVKNAQNTMERVAA